jgi:hypothetical protein
MGQVWTCDRTSHWSCAAYYLLLRLSLCSLPNSLCRTRLIGPLFLLFNFSFHVCFLFREVWRVAETVGLPMSAVCVGCVRPKSHCARLAACWVLVDGLVIRLISDCIIIYMYCHHNHRHAVNKIPRLFRSFIARSYHCRFAPAHCCHFACYLAVQFCVLLLVFTWQVSRLATSAHSQVADIIAVTSGCSRSVFNH